MSRMKNNLIFIFFLLAGIIVGSLVASMAEGVSFLSWLAYGSSIGISANNPMILDLAIIKIAFGFEMGINIAQIIFILIALACYKGFGKNF